MKTLKKIRNIASILMLVLVLTGCESAATDDSTKGYESRHYDTVKIKGTVYNRILDNDYELNNDVYRERFECAQKGINTNFGDAYIDADTIDKKYKSGAIITYEEYVKLCDYYNFYQKYDDESKNYFVLMYGSNYSWFEFNVIDYEESEDTAVVFFRENSRGVMASGDGWFVVIPTDKTKLEMRACYDEEELNNLKKYRTVYDPNDISVDKPVIYLYPEEDNTGVHVTLDYAGEVTCTYPKYDFGWDVSADKDGTLHVGNQTYNYLYWEGLQEESYELDEGFCVKGEDTAVFLEQKLEELGLNRKEANEFIVYWLPRMQTNNYNIIKFVDEEYTDSARLKIMPEPDRLIRVFMVFKPSYEYIDITPQQFATPDRKGFTVVEWGGSELR